MGRGEGGRWREGGSKREGEMLVTGSVAHRDRARVSRDGGGGDGGGDQDQEVSDERLTRAGGEVSTAGGDQGERGGDQRRFKLSLQG